MGNYLVLLTVSGIILFGMIKKTKVFDTFLEGAREGLHTAVGIMPALTSASLRSGLRAQWKPSVSLPRRSSEWRTFRQKRCRSC